MKQIERARASTSEEKQVGEELVEQGLLTEEQAAQALAGQIHLPYIDLRRDPPHPGVIALVPEQLARQHRLIPVRIEGNALLVAMADPTDIVGLDAVRLVTQRPVKPAVAPASQIMANIQICYGFMIHRSAMIGDPSTQVDVTDEAVRTVDFLVSHALHLGATDIHIEPEEDIVGVRCRIDGFLYPIATIQYDVYCAVIRRLKALASLDIAEERLPQEGAFETTINGHTVDVRCAFIPTTCGEKATLRLLDKTRQVMDLSRLGMRKAVREIYGRLIHRPHGLILVSGPASSGKSTTLASTLVLLNTGNRSIVTIEDPVEYRLPGVMQIQVNPDAGLDFARGLRSILRHDPDIIMIGEIRDPETARTATHAAMAGILVLATIHAGNAPAGLLRLVRMGVPPYLVASAVIGVVSQRLVRLLCSYCKQPVEAPTDPISWIRDTVGETPLEWEEIPLPRPAVGRGCEKCHFMGYSGRTGIFEVLPVTDSIQRLILSGASVQKIQAQASAEGMRSMCLDGALKVLEGLTTMDEVRRVT